MRHDEVTAQTLDFTVHAASKGLRQRQPPVMAMSEFMQHYPIKSADHICTGAQDSIDAGTNLQDYLPKTYSSCSLSNTAVSRQSLP